MVLPGDSNMKPTSWRVLFRQIRQTDRPRNPHTKVKSGLKETCRLVQTKGDVKSTGQRLTLRNGVKDTGEPFGEREIFTSVPQITHKNKLCQVLEGTWRVLWRCCGDRSYWRVLWHCWWDRRTRTPSVSLTTDYFSNLEKLVWWLTEVIPVLGRLRQEDCQKLRRIIASPSPARARLRPCLKSKQTKKRPINWNEKNSTAKTKTF